MQIWALDCKHCHAPLATSAVSAAAAAAAKPGFTPLIAICFYAMCDRRGAARFGRLTKVVEAAALWGGGDAGTPDTGRGGQPPPAAAAFQQVRAAVQACARPAAAAASVWGGWDGQRVV